MDEAEELSRLISDIYDASLDPSRWIDALQKSCAYLRSSSTNLFSHDVAVQRASVHFQWGNDPYYEKLYLEKYVKLNPLFPAATFVGVGVVQSQYEIVPREEFIATRFYEEWVKPQRIVDSAGINLERTASRSAMLVFRRNDQLGLVDEAMLRRVRLVAPHVRRAIVIGNIISFHQATTDTLTATLSQIGSGVFLVDARGRITFANEQGRAMLDEGKILRQENGGVLIAAEPEHARGLQDALTASSGGDRTVGIKGIAVPLADTGDGRWLAHVLPLTSGARQATGSYHSATAAVFVRKNLFAVKSWLETMATTYKLTPSEIRVLQGIVELGGTPAVADALGISKATARTHLHRIFAKTGTNRQADLVKLIATVAGPFPG